MVLNVFIFEAFHEECYVTQFNQLNLNSSFSIWLLTNWLICCFMWKQLLKVGLFCNIRHNRRHSQRHEEFSNVLSKVLLVIMVQAEFFPVNCPFSPPYPVNCPCQRPFYKIKNHLRNMIYFLLEGNLDSCSNLCNTQQSNFRNSKTKWYA